MQKHAHVAKTDIANKTVNFEIPNLKKIFT